MKWYVIIIRWRVSVWEMQAIFKYKLKQQWGLLIASAQAKLPKIAMKRKWTTILIPHVVPNKENDDKKLAITFRLVFD